MGKSKHALVARLDDTGRAQVQSYLERNGFQVTVVGNGADALAELEGFHPDLMVVDGVLPKLSGFELCRLAKARSFKAPVVLVVEENDSYGRGRARTDGADLILSEPLVADDLEDLLKVRTGDGGDVTALLSDSAPNRDRFLKELLKGGPARNDPIVAKISDPLTGLNHKSYIAMKLEEEFKKALRYRHPLALIFVDIENYADTCGRAGKPVGQEMLLEVASIFLCESRDVDSAGRVDDARFMLLLPNTDLAGARVMADRVFQQVCSRKVSHGTREIPIRASVGIAALPSEDVSTVDEFAERALRAMKTAENLGGNRICAWGDALA